MNRFKLFVCICLLAFVFAGCATHATTDVATEPVASTIDEVTTPETTAVPTTAQPTTAQPTTAEDDIVYTAVSVNKVSDDIEEEDPIEPPFEIPRDPNATGDEATRPQYTTTDTRYKYIAFTFDDGPHSELTYKFVNKLAQYGGVGTFYVVGNRVYGEQAKALKYAYDMGNEIGVHGYTHEYYYDTCSDSRFKSELSKTAKVIKNVTGEAPLTMRPIGGGITSSRVKSSGYVVVNWNVDSNDWRYTGRGYYKDQNVNTIYKNVINATDANDIILFHEIYYNSYDAFCKVIDKLYKKGYRFVTVSQLLGVDSSDRGTFYYSAD